MSHHQQRDHRKRDRSRSPYRHGRDDRESADRRDHCDRRDSRHYKDDRDSRGDDRDRRTDEKLRRLEERRKQDEIDAEYEWGASAKAASKEPFQKSKIEDLEEKHSSFTRYQDDQRLNAQMQGTVRWDDPARHFVEELRPKVQKYRVQPNRFGIDPGKAWDGVDRSNGFEIKYFQAKAKLVNQKDLEHQYGVQNY